MSSSSSENEKLSLNQKAALSFLASQYPAATSAASVAIIVLMCEPDATPGGSNDGEGLRGYQLLLPLVEGGYVATVSTDKTWYRITEKGLQVVGWTTKTPKTK